MSRTWWDKLDLTKLNERELEILRKYMSGEVEDVDLPHRSGKMFSWQREVWDSRAKMLLLNASNQSGKSIIQIRKHIEWATNKELWPTLWKDQPTHFWYLYPDKTTLDIEFNEKWRRWLPGIYHQNRKNDLFSWKKYPKSDSKPIEAIEWGSGLTTYFFTYTKRPSTLQAQSVYKIDADEELPENHYSELQFRLSAVSGYFSMVFTATLGQDMWRRAMQPEAHEEELFPMAWKKQISQYDCMYYDDGTPGIYTPEMILDNISKCKSEAEVDRRVRGKFVVDTKRLVPTFEPKKHVIPKAPIPEDWKIYSAVDMGSGGETGHPAAILFLAVDSKPKPTRGKFFLGWKGTKGYETTSGDVYKKYVALRDDNKLKPIKQVYDHSSAEFRITAARHSDPFVKANKDRDRGIPLLNTLFKYDALEVMLDPELGKLVSELSTARPSKIASSKTGDDLLDCARYLVTAIIWDEEAILKGVATKERDIERNLQALDTNPADAELEKKAAESLSETREEIYKKQWDSIKTQKDTKSLEMEDYNAYLEDY